jgi:hypothetical protein
VKKSCRWSFHSRKSLKLLSPDLSAGSVLPHFGPVEARETETVKNLNVLTDSSIFPPVSLAHIGVGANIRIINATERGTGGNKCRETRDAFGFTMRSVAVAGGEVHGNENKHCVYRFAARGGDVCLSDHVAPTRRPFSGDDHCVR